MERGRYNVGNSRMSKDCITYGASSPRNDPRSMARKRKCEREREREKAGESSTLPSLSFVKGNTIISSSLFAILKYVRRRSDCFYLLPEQEMEKEGGEEGKVSIAFVVCAWSARSTVPSMYCTHIH